MIEPRAWYVENYGIYWREGRQPESIKFPSTFLPSPDMPDPPRTLLKLTTVADVLASLREPSEAMWGGLARDIVFWLDTTDKRTPRSLFEFLGNVGREVPEWLKAHMEMANLDHAISKGTRAIIIFLAMLDQFEKDVAKMHGER